MLPFFEDRVVLFVFFIKLGNVSKGLLSDELTEGPNGSASNERMRVTQQGNDSRNQGRVLAVASSYEDIS